MGQTVYIFQAGKITNVRFDKIVPYLIHARRLHMGIPRKHPGNTRETPGKHPGNTRERFKKTPYGTF